MSYTYGMITLNSGQQFRARRDDETGKISFMGHAGKQNASVKVSKSFKENYEAMVPAQNRYRFPDEYENPSMSQSNSHDAEWKMH